MRSERFKSVITHNRYTLNMRLTKIKIIEILRILISPEVTPIVEELLEQDNYSEFDLATKTKLDIKQVRKLLYLLYNHNLVSFNRKKDKQKGWYIYYWTIIPDSVRFSYFKMKRNLIVKLEERLKQEKEELFFVCPQNCVRINFDESMEYEFHCPECGELLAQDDSRNRIGIIEKKLGETKVEVSKLLEQRHARREKKKERQKDDKVKAKKKVVKKAAKKKTTKKKAVKKAVKKKVAKKSTKKKAAKKVTKKKAVKKAAKTRAIKKAVKKKVSKKKTVKKDAKKTVNKKSKK